MGRDAGYKHLGGGGDGRRFGSARSGQAVADALQARATTDRERARWAAEDHRDEVRERARRKVEERRRPKAP